MVDFIPNIGQMMMCTGQGVIEDVFYTLGIVSINILYNQLVHSFDQIMVRVRTLIAARSE